jgi:CheY-like chemotaxis protein
MNSDQKPGRWQESIGNDAPQQPAKVENSLDPTTKTGMPIGPAASTGSGEWRKKTVLLVDSNLRSRESRAKVMRTLGVHVDCAASASAARVRLAAEKYNLILVDLGRDVDSAESLVHEIRARNSRQLVQFLVGSPLFVAATPNGHSSRPRRAPAPVPATSGQQSGTPAVAGIDFGQKVRDAEAEEIANETGAQ